MNLENINMILEWISDKIYVYLILGLLVLCGIYFTIKMRFAQIRLFPESIKYLREKSHNGKVSSFQALMTCTASKVGTANIAGVATAVVVGGPGAIFWIWLMAVIGSASSIVEATLAQMYKVKSKENGLFVGGPAYYIKNALGKKRLGIIFATLFVFCYMFAFSALQANNMSTAFENFIPSYRNTAWPWIIGIIFTCLIAVVVFGGIYRISFVSSYLVPAMATVYLLVGIYIFFTNINRIPEVFSLIFRDAFDFKAITGGFSGSVVLLGIKRGLLSNEAGMGSAPNSAATADTSHPVKQGIMQVLSVGIDTFFICSTSAFIILLSKVKLNSEMQGIPLMQKAVSSQVGAWGEYFIAVSVVCFAFSAIIGNFGISEPNILFIKEDEKFVKCLRTICLFAVAGGCVLSPKLVWNLADIAMALLAIVNLVAITMLTDKFMICFKDYLKKRKSGKDIVFNATECDIDDTTLWK
mgnify:FL=1